MNGPPNAYPYGIGNGTNSRENGSSMSHSRSTVTGIPTTPSCNLINSVSDGNGKSNSHNHSHSHSTSPHHEMNSDQRSTYPYGPSNSSTTTTTVNSHFHYPSASPNAYSHLQHPSHPIQHSPDPPTYYHSNSPATAYYPNQNAAPSSHAYNHSHQRFNSHPPLIQNQNHIINPNPPATSSSLHSPKLQTEQSPDPNVGNNTGSAKGKKRQRMESTERKPRVNLSCLPCKQRKIKCDRNVPQCESCIKRGISHLCAFGDERDDLVPKNNSPTTAALLAKINHLETQLKNYRENGVNVKKGKGKQKSEEVEEDEEDQEEGDDEEEETRLNESEEKKPKQTSKKKAKLVSTSNVVADPDFETESSRLVEAQVSAISSEPSHWGKPIQKPSASEIKAAATAPESSDVRPVPIKGGGGKPIDDHTLDNFYNLLPSRKITDYLIEHFIMYVHNSIPCLHIPTLRRQYLNVMNRKLKGNNKDLNVLSLIFIIFEASCESLSPSEIFKLGLTSTRQDLASLLDSFHTLSHRLLHLSHFYSAPTLEGFQAIVITRSYWFERRAVVGYSALNVRAIRLAQSIGLHKLGSYDEDWDEWERRKASRDQDKIMNIKKEDTGHEDGSEIKELLPTLFWRRQDTAAAAATSSAATSANPNGANSASSNNTSDAPTLNHMDSSHPKPNAKDSNRSASDSFGWDSPNPILTREIGRRIWSCLCIIEYFLCGYSGALPAIMPNAPGVTTTLPVSIEDEALDSIDYETKRIYEKPLEEPTQLSFTTPHYRTSLCAVNSYAAMQRGDGYETVLKCNQEVLDILGTLPSFYRFDGSEELPRVKNLHKERPYLNLHRSVLNDLLFYRLLVLNRMYMGIGYKNERYSESTKLCLESAHGIIKARLDFAKQRAYPLDLWITIVHVFHAACTLQLHLLHETNLHGWTSEMTRHQEAADDADRFLKSISYQSTGGKSGGSLCEALSKLREKTVARQKQFHPETPAPPRHTSHFLNVVLLDRSHSIGGGNGLKSNSASPTTIPSLNPSSFKERDRPQSSSSGSETTSNSNSSFNNSNQNNSHFHPLNNPPSIPLTGGVSQRPENIFPNEKESVGGGGGGGNGNLLLSDPSTASSSDPSPSTSNQIQYLNQTFSVNSSHHHHQGGAGVGVGNGSASGSNHHNQDAIENELPPADCITELQPYLDSFRWVEKNDSDDSFLQILEELFSN